jgi:hypothetical protein
MSTTFQTAAPQLQKLDPLKRVNYTFGLVLGVEEFLQSDTYFLAKHYLENRLLHGYGTVCGLDVIAQTSPQLEVQVTPGWAINPKGQEIYVPQLMCVQVNDWLQANLPALQAAFGGHAPATLGLCVVLCYRECKTDVVPIPGEPCQTQSSSTAPSRIADSFELMLCLNQPASPPLGSPPSVPSGSSGLCEFRPTLVADDAVQAFARLLSEIQVSTTGPFLTLEELKQLVRGLLQSLGPPVRGAQPLVAQPLTSPPQGPPYHVQAFEASGMLRAAYRTWITEVRPFLAAAQGAGPCCPPPEKCVLLAEVALSLNPSWAATAVTIDDSRRPFLVPTGLLQETALAEASAAVAQASYKAVAAGFFDMTGNPKGPTYNNLTATSGSAPANGEYLLSFDGYQNPATSPPRGLSYIVKGTVQETNVLPASARATVEVIAFAASGIWIRVLDTNLKPLGAGFGFMVEISQIGGAS